MSLLRRVERAQQGADAQNAGTVTPVLAPAATRLAQVAAREELLREIRLRLQEEVSRASSSLFDAAATDVHARVEAIVDRVIRANGFAVTRDERLRLVEELRRRDRGPRAARAAPPGRDDHRGHGQRPEPGLHRAGAARSSASSAPSSNDEHVLRIIDRIVTPDRTAHRRVEPAGGRPPARRLAGQRDHRAALARRAGHHDPEVRGQAVHRRRPRPLRHGDGRDVRLPAGLRRGPPQHLRLGRHRLGQDDDAQRPLVVHPRRRADRHDRGRRRAAAPPGARGHARGPAVEPRGRRARSRSATCCATPCTCGPTGSSSASAARARPST